MSDQQNRPGRPRSSQADEAILASARRLMAEGGLGNLTVEGTAQIAGVAKTTVYRRYPTKLDLAVAAIANLVSSPPDDQGSQDPLTIGLRTYDLYLDSPGSQAAFLAVAAAAAADPEVHERFSQTVLTPVREQIEEIVAAAQESGIAADPPVDFVFDVAMGTLLHRHIIRQEPLSDDFQALFVQLIRYLYELPG